jgi:intron-binding protein aquarius
MFPATRAVDDTVESVDMEGVEHLGNYVFEMTKAKVEALKKGGGQLPPPATETKVDDEDDEDAEGTTANGEEEEVDVEEA